MHRVVGVAGPAGAGKTTLVRGLVRALGDAAPIYMDSYQRITRQPVRRIVQWLERGADFDEFSIPLLGEHLRRLKRGETVMDPVTMEEIPARRHIVFETHFGRRHRDTGQHIDLLVWVATPLDVALARNLSDLIRPLRQPGAQPRGEDLARLHNYVTTYLADVRALLLAQEKTVGADADLVVDGSRDPAGMVEQVRSAILTRLA
jgi:uridine kinase